MNFRIQDLTKTLIPGIMMFFLSSLFICNIDQFNGITNLIKDTMAIWTIVFLMIAYVCGYFVDLVGSLLEKGFYTYFSRPSLYLLNNTGKSIKLSNSNLIIEYLCDKLRKSSQHPFTKESALEVFKCANVYKDYVASSQTKERLAEYYFSKIFSRNLSSSFLISFGIYVVYYLFNHHSLYFNFLSILLLLGCVFSGYRWRVHAFYYTRQVFYMACEPVLKVNNN